MDDEHVLALVEAVHGAHLDAVHGFAANTAIVDDVGQLGVFPADCRGQLIHHVRHRGARSCDRRFANNLLSGIVVKFPYSAWAQNKTSRAWVL